MGLEVLGQYYNFSTAAALSIKLNAVPPQLICWIMDSGKKATVLRFLSANRDTVAGRPIFRLNSSHMPPEKNPHSINK
jgi:hypothetical protein